MIQGVVKHTVGNVKLHSDCQMASYHAPWFQLQHCKHNFTTTNDSSGRNRLRRDHFILTYEALSKECA